MTSDADLQNDPRDIARLLAKLDEGYDIVSGWRTERKEPFLSRRLPSIMANRMISGATQVVLHDYGCSLKAYRSEVAKNVRLYGELHRFIPALASWMGVRVAEVPVNDRKRRFGKSKYGIGRTFPRVSRPDHRSIFARLFDAAAPCFWWNRSGIVRRGALDRHLPYFREAGVG